MSVDVVGINPINKSGDYFRASIWAWHPIVSVLQQCCSAQDRAKLPDSFFQDISVNAKFGATESQCQLLANRLIQFLEHNVHGAKPVEAALSPMALALAEVASSVSETSDRHKNQFTVTDDMLKQFVEFLQNCGGFSVH